MNRRRIIFCLSVAAILMMAMSGLALAFCPMCKTAIEGASGAREIAASLNLAALVMLAPPVLIFVALFGWFYRLRNANAAPASLDEADEKRGALTD